MIKEINSTEGFIQKCDCGAENSILFSQLSISSDTPRMIQLPTCPVCKTRIEILILNGATDPHALLVARVFAEVGIR